ncbi:MAG TPA: Fe-S cluster assembly protein SufD [Chthoniobacterales bacterium]|jgi:Fe-S cluster assembly protein SufD|nr:Fe-S cluster assembly protein SufD [Chthoniobacterales bacterium]
MSLVVHDELMQAGSILSGPVESRDLPDWFRDQQGEAWREFQSLPYPNRKDQLWRFSNVNLLDLSPFKLAPELSDDDRRNVLKYSRGLDRFAARLIFANDQLIERDVVSEQLRKRGVIFQPLERAMVEHPDLFGKHFMSQPAILGSAKFAALHKALVSSGTFLFVPRGLEIELPIEIFHWLRHDNMSVFPHLLLVTDELAKVTIIEHFRSCDRKAPGFACGVNDLIAGPGAKVAYVCTQNWADNVIALQMNTTTVDHDASAMSLNLHLGGRYSRFESLSRLVGEGARSDLLAVSVATREQEFDARTLQDHISPHTASDLLYKNALDDRASCTFGGLIRVEPHAHFTDAYQKVRNLLLSDDAEANSMPGLEILADNVRCTHGATSGQIDEEEMFYLRSRGIPVPVAQRLVVSGFLNEVIDRLKASAIADHLRDLIDKKFAQS